MTTAEILYLETTQVIFFFFLATILIALFILFFIILDQHTIYHVTVNNYWVFIQILSK